MSRQYPYSTEDNDSVFSSTENLHHGVHIRQTTSGTRTTGNQPAAARLSGEWSASRSRSSSSNHTEIFPPKADPLRLVKADGNPLVNQAKETMNALERQKLAQKETKTTQQVDSSDFDWEKNLSSWKDRRKSKPTYQPKVLEIEGNDPDDIPITGKRASKTFKELMDEKEKRSNGNGMYTYEIEEKPSLDVTTVSKSKTSPSGTDTSLITTSNTTAITAASTITNITDGKVLPSQPSDSSVINSTLTSSRSRDGDFYFSSSSLGGVVSDIGHEIKTSHSASERRPEEDTVLVQQKSQEISLEFQAPTLISAPETKVLIQKTAAFESTPSLSDSTRNSERKPWHSTAGQESVLAPRPKVNAYGVTLREKTTGSTQARPYSYAFTPSTERSDALNVRGEAVKPPTRYDVTSHVTRSTASSRESLSGTNTNPPAEALRKDRRVKSNWELNYAQAFSGDKNDSSVLKSTQRSNAGASSSDKFKQALSLFQSKEAEGGQPLQTTKPSVCQSLRTQKSVGISKHSMEETARPTTTTRSTGVDLRQGRATNMYSFESGIPGQRNLSAARDFKSLEREDQYGLRKCETKKESANSSSIENSSNRSPLLNVVSSNDDEEEKVLLTKTGKSSTNIRANEENTANSLSRVDLEFKIPKTSSEGNSHGVQSERIGVGSNVSWTLRLERDPTKASKTEIDISLDKENENEDLKMVKSVTTSREPRTSNITEPIPTDRKENDIQGNTSAISDWRMDQRRASSSRSIVADFNEPTTLYAFKYQSKNSEESVVESREGGKPTTRTDLKQTSCVEKPMETKYYSANKSTTTTGTLLPELRETCSHTEYKIVDDSSRNRPLVDTDSRKTHTYDLSRSSEIDLDSYQQHKKETQQPSISDIFSKRSAAAVRGRTFATDYSSHLSDKTSTSHLPKTVDLQSSNERCDITVTLDARFDDKDFFQNEKQSTEIMVTNAEKHIDDVSDFHDDSWPNGKVDNSMTQGERKVEATPLDASRRRHHGLDRIRQTLDDSLEKNGISAELGKAEEYIGAEKSNKQTPLHYDLCQQSAFEVKFSSSELKTEPYIENITMETEKEKIVHEKVGDMLIADPLEIRNKESKNNASQLIAFSPLETDIESPRKSSLDIYVPGDAIFVGDEHTSKSQRNDSYPKAIATNSPKDTKLPEVCTPSLFEETSKESSNHSCKLNESLIVGFSESDVLHHPETEYKLKKEEDAKTDDVSSHRYRRHHEATPQAIDSRTEKAFYEARPPPEERIPDPNFPAFQGGKTSPVCRSPSPIGSPPPLPTQPIPQPEELPPRHSSIEEIIPAEAPPSPIHRPPLMELKLTEPELKLIETSRSPEHETLIDFDEKIDARNSSKKSVDLFSTNEEQDFKPKTTETDGDIEKVDKNSNITIDVNSPPAIILEEQIIVPPAPAVSLSFDPKQQEITVELTPEKRHETKEADIKDSYETKHETMNDVKDSSMEIVSNHESKDGGSSPKRKPPEPPKTKPKPKIQKVATEIRSPGSDDWSFLPSTELLNTSANRDKCRITKGGNMAARRRPKSAFFPAASESTDLFNVYDGAYVGAETNGIASGIQQNASENREAPTNAVDQSSRSMDQLRMKASLKGTRPLSYMGELNSSLAQKFKNAQPALTDAKEKTTHDFKDEDEGVAAAGRKVPPAIPSFSSSQTIEAESQLIMETEEEAPTNRIKSKGGMKIPGLMDELNFSLKKKFQESPKEEIQKESLQLKENENAEKMAVCPPVELPTGDLLTIGDSFDSVVGNKEEETGPPPLPNAPPPLPKWSSFPMEMNVDLPPSGPPPLLSDQNFSADENYVKIEFRMTTSGSHQSPDSEKETKTTFQNFKTDETGFSYA